MAFLIPDSVFLLSCLVLIQPFYVDSGEKSRTRIGRSELRLDAAGVEKNARLINLLFNRPKNAITLDDTELVEDDAPATGLPEKYFGIEYRKATAPWQEDLKKGLVIRKILRLEDPRTFSGRLLFLGQEKKGNVEPLHLSINGIPFSRPASRIAFPHARQYTDIEWLRWYFVDLPSCVLKKPSCVLKKGDNEILMWADSPGPSWKICLSLEEEFARGSLTRTHHPNRSSKSPDGGITWNDSRLGVNDTEDGEYNVRLSLDRYVKAGEFVSPVIDAVKSPGVIKNRIKSLKSIFFIDIETPGETTATAMIRFSASPLAGDKSWTSWERVETGGEFARDLDTRRFFQWKAGLTTNNPLKSPLIKGFRVHSEWEESAAGDKPGSFAAVVSNGQVVVPSYPFTYEDLDHPGLLKLRNRFQLDKITKGAKTEFEIMMRLLNWSYRVPVKESPYSWNSNDVVVYRKGRNDKKGMPELQSNYEGRRRDAMCSLSNLALQGAMLSMGYQARYININSEAVSGHEVTEVWSNEFNKWIYMDATRDYYYYDPETNLPLNLLEIHDKLAEKLHRVESWQRPFAPETGREVARRVKIGMREGDNPVSIVEHGYHLIATMGYFRIPLRNNFFSHPLPIPVAQGYTMWGWDGYLNHYDDKFPKRTEFQRQSSRPIDFYAPLNQSQVYLFESDRTGVLKVEVDTFTPGHEIFLVRINDGEWAGRKEPAWHWKLNAGLNQMEVRTRNTRGVVGPVSCVKVIFNP